MPQANSQRHSSLIGANSLAWLARINCIRSGFSSNSFLTAGVGVYY